MNFLEKKLAKIIAEKSKNIITGKKAIDLVKLVKSKYPTQKFESVIDKLNQYSELPCWLNDAITINETFFFRHPEHYKIVGNYLENKSKQGQGVKILCCGVASGEEAYSLAMVVADKCKTPCSILGMDLSSEVIETAKQAKYTPASVSRITSEYKELCMSYLQKQKTPGQDEYLVKEQIKNMLTFKVGNAFNFPFDFFDVIFVRNILIYFDEEDREKLLGRLFAKLKPGGLLFVGAGEILSEEHTKNRLNGSTSILKKAG